MLLQLFLKVTKFANQSGYNVFLPTRHDSIKMYKTHPANCALCPAKSISIASNIQLTLELTMSKTTLVVSSSQLANMKKIIPAIFLP